MKEQDKQRYDLSRQIYATIRPKLPRDDWPVPASTWIAALRDVDSAHVRYVGDALVHLLVSGAFNYWTFPVGYVGELTLADGHTPMTVGTACDLFARAALRVDSRIGEAALTLLDVWQDEAYKSADMGGFAYVA